MPSIRNPFSLLLPCTVAVDCRKDSDPPTSTLLKTTLGMTRATPHTSIRFGRLSSTSRDNTVCFNADVVSSRGDSPFTVMPSESAPISSFRSTRAVTSALTTTFS